MGRGTLHGPAFEMPPSTVTYVHDRADGRSASSG